jgi:TolB-like protein/DNA-binding winged helix-turn-helix (wHTH) protein
MLQFGSFELHSDRHRLTDDGRDVHLTPKAFQLLVLLASSAPRVVSKQEIHEHLWPNGVVSDATVVGLVKELRRALRDDVPDSPVIRTVYKVGYAFNAPLVKAVAASAARPTLAPSELVPEISAAHEPVGGYQSRRRVGVLGAALALLLVSSALSLLPRAERDAGVSTATAFSATTPASGAELAVAVAPKRTLAVLPFANLSADADDDGYFVDGVNEELLTALSRLPDLQVAGRASSAYFRGRNDSSQTIGSTLGVEHLLTGSVRKAGERVRIAVELVNANTGYQLWSGSYDRRLGDIFEVQDEIAASVATALQVTLGLGESGESGNTRDAAAFDEFLRGVAAYHDYTPDSFLRAIEHMHRAIALDPKFSRAWSYLFCIHVAGASVVPERAEEWTRRATESLDRARDLTPEAPFVRILEARNQMLLGNRLRARAALDAMPQGYWTADIHLTRDTFRGLFLIGTGHAKDAVESLERARAADPLSPVVALYLGIARAAAGNAAAGLEEIDRGLAMGLLEPLLHGSAWLIALGTADTEEIRKRTVALSSVPGSSKELHLAMLPLLNDPKQARAALRRFASGAAAQDFVETVTVAHWAAYFDDPEFVLEQLGRIAHGSADDALLWRPVLRDTRKLPGFKDLVRREGLVEYWRSHGWPDFCRATAGDEFECG